jgi:hypothetical protein
VLDPLIQKAGKLSHTPKLNAFNAELNNTLSIQQCEARKLCPPWLCTGVPHRFCLWETNNSLSMDMHELRDRSTIDVWLTQAQQQHRHVIHHEAA